MISIFIMYSADRAKALNYTLSCLQEMPLYNQCQKILVVDTKAEITLADWEIVQVPRTNDKFCWGKMWDVGVSTAKHEKIIYLDSDRLLPKRFLEMVDQDLADDTFIFTSKHFQLLFEIPIESCKRFLETSSLEDILRTSEFIGKFRYEPRVMKPFHGPSKNVMSGSTAFTKQTYHRLGGVDHWYCGHGAYADSDFHMIASVEGCKFIDLNIPELHFPHQKLDDNGLALNGSALKRLALNNFVYYCNKWKLPMALADSLAICSGIAHGNNYVLKKLKEIKMENAKEF